MKRFKTISELVAEGYTIFSDKYHVYVYDGERICAKIDSVYMIPFGEPTEIVAPEEILTSVEEDL